MITMGVRNYSSGYLDLLEIGKMSIHEGYKYHIYYIILLYYIISINFVDVFTGSLGGEFSMNSKRKLNLVCLLCQQGVYPRF